MIESMGAILDKAKRGGYAVGAFNFQEYSDMRGIAEAAELKNSPVILMSTTGVVRFTGPRQLAHAFKGICGELRVPCALHLDHAKDIELIKECIRCGYNSVMIDASEMPFYENIETTRRVVCMAKERGVSVEAELGTIGGKEDNALGNSDVMVDPDTVAEFVERTGVDALAIAIGTVHGFYKIAPKLRFDLIEASAARTSVPLVMHGGTGLSEEDFARAIRCGISKVNFGTELKRAFTSAVAGAFNEAGGGGAGPDPMKFLKAARDACGAIAAGKMEIFGCAGKA